MTCHYAQFTKKYPLKRRAAERNGKFSMDIINNNNTNNNLFFKYNNNIDKTKTNSAIITNSINDNKTLDCKGTIESITRSVIFSNRFRPLYIYIYILLLSYLYLFILTLYISQQTLYFIYFTSYIFFFINLSYFYLKKKV